MENDEKKYEDVIKALKGLQEVKAPANFEADLQRRINSEKYSKEEKKSFWENIFVPARLIPSLGLVATVIVIFFVVESSSEEMDNPFLIEPRVREDIIGVTDYDGLKSRQEELSKQKSFKKDEPVVQPKKNEGEMKSVDDKIIIGKEKSSEMEGMAVERDYATDQNVAESFENIPDSTITAANVVESPKPTVVAETRSDSTINQTITKEELNFRQIQLTEEQQRAVNVLKNQVQSADKVNKTQK
jgi:hypothetical protein